MSEMVTVACRLPNGLHLDVWPISVEADSRSAENRVRVTINGANKSKIIGGAGFTQVAKDHWEAWYAKNKQATFLKNGHVWVSKNTHEATAEAKVRESAKTGFEGANPAEVDKRLKELDRA